ncbi:MAG TPA: NAD(P)-dependent alcohol dehydrogenase [Bacteroidales bacterium]|nr:NAD(P)-dependent alcohol dehydrogenase [Bacteroidales bacterium]
MIRVNAVSLNAADYRSMKLGIIPEKKIFGADVAGTVESVGKNITLFKPEDEAMGDLASYGFGGLAEYVTAPEKALVPKPQTLSFEAASTLPLAGITALQALRNEGNIHKGDKVLIVGSAGSVGPFAVQLAKYFGAGVTGVCSTGNMNQTLSIGADHVIDYTKENPLGGNERYSLILGINGNYPLRAYRRSLAPDGRCVMVGGSFSQIFRSLLFGWLLSFGSKKMKSLSAKPNRKDLEFLANLLENGAIRPVIDRRYTLDKTAEAMDYLSNGHATGKVVSLVEPG